MMLALSALFLLAVFVWQNVTVPQLRFTTLSDGLYQLAPGWQALDIAYLLVSIALCLHFGSILAYGSSLALLITAISNSDAAWVDAVTKGKHNTIHTWATVAMFVQMLALQALHDSGFLWSLSAAGVVLPVLAFVAVPKYKGPIAEKVAVALLIAWLVLVP